MTIRSVTYRSKLVRACETLLFYISSANTRQLENFLNRTDPAQLRAARNCINELQGLALGRQDCCIIKASSQLAKAAGHNIIIEDYEGYKPC